MGAACMGLGGMVATLTMGYTSPALPSMRADPNFSITKEQESWIGAVMPACALLGSVAAGPLVDHLGRRATLLHLTWPLVLSWVIIAQSGGVGGVILGRMVGGACVGVQAAAGSVFIAETVELKLRNIMGFFPAFLGNMGLLVSFAAGQYLSWRGLAWLGAALCLPVLPLIYPLPETPFYLTRTGKVDKSLHALKQLRSSTQEAEKEQREINSLSSDSNSSVTLWDIIQRPNLWPVSVAAGLMVAQQATGINAVVFFASSILDAGGEGTDSSSSSVLLGIVNFLGTFVGIFAIIKYKRRSLLKASTVVLVVSLLTLSLFFWAQEAGGHITTVAKTLYVVPIIALLAYMIGFSVGWGPIPWVFMVEGIPSLVRGKAVAVVVAINWASAFLVTKSFSWSMSTLGAHNTFLGYAVATFISAILLHRTMPETLGQSAAQMGRLYKKAVDLKQE